MVGGVSFRPTPKWNLEFDADWTDWHALKTTDNPYVRTATKAMHDVFATDTVFIRSGGSIPIVGDFIRELHIPTLMMGFGLPDDNLHAPNEKFLISNFYQGIESIIRFLEIAGESAAS